MKEKELVINLEIVMNYYTGSPSIIATDEDGEVVASGFEGDIDEAIDETFLPDLRKYLLKKWEELHKS